MGRGELTISGQMQVWKGGFLREMRMRETGWEIPLATMRDCSVKGR